MQMKKNSAAHCDLLQLGKVENTLGFCIKIALLLIWLAEKSAGIINKVKMIEQNRLMENRLNLAAAFLVISSGIIGKSVMRWELKLFG